MLILGTALGPITLAALAAAASAVGAALAAVIYRKQPDKKAYGPEHDHEAEYQKLVKRLRDN